MRLSELDLIAIQVEVLFVHNQVGKMKYVNEQGNPKAPRCFLGRTREGSITRYHCDLDDETVGKIEKLIREPSNHIEIAKIIHVLNEERTVKNIWMGPAFMFSNNLHKPTRTIQITEKNKELLRENFPNLIEQMEWRQPYFAIVKNEKVVSICCSARSTPVAAEASVETLAENGYGTDVVTAWAISIQEENRISLYSTSWDNYASQEVARKLNLINYGMNLHIT
ncbi:GNAT family N-acetyltransferase [Bacillus cereus]|uniref:GNAT family N-acetyltransferase n=1 Tax=Bacillus TaxID=1386 RepID=UPI000BF68384|nr:MULTISPECIES: GNAT family N-acetyltransferase [Bacillus cereus group]PFN32935.1 GNAT family N-acetyltransferase [Bacillus cereus]MCU5209041.1 GNAT family N-acetyltransferase [Bacillus paranthracis]MDA2162174.1 GNAT family N-acetyltransferase [Bacillus cereus group sp. Bc252]MDF9511849.1 GNAT family N-acetyltransferase [Bacillus paranthracis]MDF9669524.1 GNAT family N-acetyltransferase [Bacillus paranthracis]